MFMRDMNYSRQFRCFGFGRAFFRRSSETSHSILRPHGLVDATISHNSSAFDLSAHKRFLSVSTGLWFWMMNRSPEKKTTAKPPQKASEKPDKPDKASPESSRGHGHGTRAAVLLEEELRAEKERYFSMPLDRKRKMYKCGDGKYVTLKEIPIWPELDSKRTPSSSKKSSKTSTAEKPEAPVPAVPKGRKRYAVNEELNRKVSLYRGDITTLEIDAIVNAANSSLMGGGGVDGAIHSAAGSFLKKECATLNGCDTGDAKITYGFKLPAKHVIHTVGPIGEKKDCLQSAYKRCLEVMKENKLTTVAFPCISTGIYGYPVESATHVALGTIREWLEKDKYCEKVERIILCVFLKRDVEVYEELLHVYFPLSEDRVEPDKAGPGAARCLPWKRPRKTDFFPTVSQSRRQEQEDDWWWKRV